MERIELEDRNVIDMTNVIVMIMDDWCKQFRDVISDLHLLWLFLRFFLSLSMKDNTPLFLRYFLFSLQRPRSVNPECELRV